MSWDQFISGCLSLCLIALARIMDRWLPPSHPAKVTGEGPPAPAPAPGPPSVGNAPPDPNGAA